MYTYIYVYIHIYIHIYICSYIWTYVPYTYISFVLGPGLALCVHQVYPFPAILEKWDHLVEVVPIATFICSPLGSGDRDNDGWLVVFGNPLLDYELIPKI